MSSLQNAPKFSVLILGSTQAGKSALIEHIRSYADPGYDIDGSLLGNGVVSKTENTTPILINSNLPAYEAYRNNTGEIFDLKNLAAQYEDEEDYRDILLSRPDDIDIRLVPQDVNASSPSLEFRFLDTPGLNGTQGRDSENTADIVKEVISTRSFNLIIVVVSSKNPLTEEKQLALEYFAFVLRGLHSRIIFLYTHVDYSDTHFTNNAHHLDMSMRNKTLSTIFRRHDDNAIFDPNNIEMYPNFAIDLVSRNRPIVQCLIRNTIREILTMATKPPAVLDTGAMNIRRIRTVVYPTESGQQQRKKLEYDLRALYTFKPEKEKYSVLVMGKTQAGKSALVEHIKNYANPSYAIDRSLLGNGNLSKTESTRPFYIESNLPAYEAFRKDTGEVLALDNLATKCEDEEDYRKILFSHEKDVGLRLAPHHPNEPSELVEFRFLDTPGLNDTNDRDSSHAVNIISEIINTRSFNLIVIIVSYKNPLTQEQQLALEYYANVFRGLHTRIMFLHTHVDYAEIHHTNAAHYLNMKMKNKALSKMFRRYEFEGVFDEENVREYPSMTIDLVSKKRPVINCLIRNTIREILQMATAPAVVLDTSGQNIDRIRAITHPSKFNDEERKLIKQRFAAEAAKLEKPAEEEEVDVGGTDLEQINILLIGDVQSGKTSLVETFRLYADTAYQAKTEHITQGNSRFADEKVKITAFLADLHTVQIRRLKASTGGFDLVDLEQEARTLSEEDVENLLNLGPKAAETTINSSNGGKRYRFNIYEGPSLNESAENFEKNIFSVHRTLVESEQKFHQVLFTLAPGRLTRSIRTTIRACSDIFSDFSSLFSFVHTKIDYLKLHHGNKQFQDSMKERQELLQRYIQSSAAPYLIDCNLQSNWPVQRAKTYNVVHDILKSATSQTPIGLKSPLMKKTPWMLSVDNELKWLARNDFLSIQEEICQNNDDLIELHSKICQLDIEYKAKEVVNSAKNKEDVATRDDMEIVFEDKYTASAEPYPEIYSRTMTFKRQPRTIEKVHMVCEYVEIELALGGEGFDHWMIIYRRTSGVAASLAVKLYAKKQDCAGNPVGETKELAEICLLRLELEKQLATVEERIKCLWQVQKEYHLLRNWISRMTLPKVMLEKIIKSEVYEALDIPYDKIEEIYLMPVDISVLVFGKTQAGKSTFIQYVLNYADNQHGIDGSVIGTGIVSKTSEPIRYNFWSTQPAYTVCDKTTKMQIDISAISEKCKDVEDYKDALNNRKTTLAPVRHHSLTARKFRKVKFTLLDTPGIEDTDGKDTKHAPKIIDEMAKVGAFNLIVVVVSNKDPISKNQQLAFDYYSKVIKAFQRDHSNVVFVYTHVPFEDSHPTNKVHHESINLRHKALSHLFRGPKRRPEQGDFIGRTEIQEEEVELFPWYTIDFNQNKRPITQCIRLNILRDILQLAIRRRPMCLDTSAGNLDRISRIKHPDALNRKLRNKILGPVKAILGVAAQSGADKSVNFANEEEEEAYEEDQEQEEEEDGEFGRAGHDVRPSYQSTDQMCVHEESFYRGVYFDNHNEVHMYDEAEADECDDEVADMRWDCKICNEKNCYKEACKIKANEAYDSDGEVTGELLVVN